MNKIKPQGIIAIIVLVSLLLFGGKMLVDKFTPHYEDVNIKVSSEKVDFLNDPDVKKYLIQKGWNINVMSKTDDVNLTNVDWPATIAGRLEKTASSSITNSYNGHLVLGVGNRAVQSLRKNGYVTIERDRNYIKRTHDFVLAVCENKAFQNTDNNSKPRIETPNPTTSNAGVLGLYWLYNCVDNSNDDFSQSIITNNQDKIKKNYSRFDMLPDSGELIASFISSPGSRMILTHENLLISKIQKGELNNAVLVYPNPTLPIQHPIYSLDKKYDSLIKLLVNDQYIQKIAWQRYGLMPSIPVNKQECSITPELQKYGVVSDIQSQNDMPTKLDLSMIKSSQVR